MRLLAWSLACVLAVAPALMAWIRDGRWRWLLVGGAVLIPLFLVGPGTIDLILDGNL